MALQLIFGMTYTNLDEYLLFAKGVIVKELRNHTMVRVKIPSSEKMQNTKGWFATGIKIYMMFGAPWTA